MGGFPLLGKDLGLLDLLGDYFGGDFRQCVLDVGLNISAAI